MQSQLIQKERVMIDFNDTKKEIENPVKEVRDLVRATYYKTVPGCYTPPPYKMDYCKLSEVLG